MSNALTWRQQPTFGHPPPLPPAHARSERRALSVVYEEDAEAYDEAMVDVCASMVGVDRESVISVWTSFGPDGAAEDAARRGLMTSSRWVRRGCISCLFVRGSMGVRCLYMARGEGGSCHNDGRFMDEMARIRIPCV